MERKTTGSILVKQDQEIEECKKDLDSQKDNEKKLKARQKDLQEELEHTLKRIEQLQRGVSTPVRRKPSLNTGSRNASPYSRNSSGSKKMGTPGSNNGKPNSTANVYNRLGNSNAARQTSNPRIGGTNAYQRQSPTI